MFKTVCQQEAVRRNTQCGVMMKATPVSSLVMAQAELLFQFLVVPLNAPAHLGDSDQFYKRRGSGQRRKPVLRRFSLTAWPFDQQPFLFTQALTLFITMRRTHAQRRETRRQHRMAPLAPVHRVPAARFQGFSHYFNPHWRSTHPTSPPSRRASHFLAWLGRQWPRARQPHRCARWHSHAVLQLYLAQPLAFDRREKRGRRRRDCQTLSLSSYLELPLSFCEFLDTFRW